jgi:hypothetical protein
LISLEYAKIPTYNFVVQLSTCHKCLIQKALDGENGAAKNIVALNAGAAIYVSGVVEIEISSNPSLECTTITCLEPKLLSTLAIGSTNVLS